MHRRALFRFGTCCWQRLGERLLDQNGAIKRFINVFVNNDEIRTLQGADTPVAAGDRVSIVPAMAGGR